MLQIIINIQISQIIESKMINQITCNSNNAIELSRGQLLNWLNSLLKINYSKIEQLGTGAAYCQLLDFIYPGKVPLAKVNWKAKFDYQYLNNFKVLQQSFTKLNVMKHIDVQKLVKCKYQDNLQFLQWFKKIFDTTGSYSKEYDPVIRRGDKQQKQKQNKNPVPYLSPPLSSIDSIDHSKQGSYISSNQASKQSTERTMIKNQPTDHINNQQVQNTNYFSNRNDNEFKVQSQCRYKGSYSNCDKTDDKLVAIFTQNQNQEKEFYLTKIKQIQYLMDTWDTKKPSLDLIEDIRKIILATPQVAWKIQDGAYKQNNQ